MFWRRKPKDDTPLDAPEDQEDVGPEDAPAGWEPDPADFDPPIEGSAPPITAPSDAAPAVPPTPDVAADPVPDPLPDVNPALVADPVPPPLPASAAPGAIPGWIVPDDDRPGDLAAGLEKSRTGFIGRLRGFLGTGPDGPSWDDVEETLIAGDVGAGLAIDIVERARRRHDPGGPEAAVRAELAALLVPRDADAWHPQPAGPGLPAVILVVGVNGTGKTTTIGKLASRYQHEGLTVLLAAADTFRAAAIEQLTTWASRSGAQVVAHAPGADPGAVVFDALDAAVARRIDLVIADTAGRLHTKVNLMDELAKVRRIVDKRLPGARPETLFVLDATTGQNGLAQARAFHEAVGLTGVVLTKLDSTSKGGIVFAIEDALKVPVRFVGVGEKVGDLLPFDPDAFVAALFA
ncbi:MAG TPA: signal recognition particle-docking protein FtsY [Patescibacteria group bacterium]|nr:signal recognition particle-docking protein FtsY [Patescibacteria group bacterium]